MISSTQVTSESEDPAVESGKWIDFWIQGGIIRTGRIWFYNPVYDDGLMHIKVPKEIPGQRLSGGTWRVDVNKINRVYSSEESLMMDIKYGVD